MVAAVKQEEHHRSWAKVKGHAIAHMKVSLAINRQAEAPLLDVGHTDRRTRRRPLHHERVTLQAVCNDRGKAIDVNDVVDLRLLGDGGDRTASLLRRQR
jgi:hypothetical protein